MNKTKIEWTDYTWNPITGCTKVSAGCKHCYAETMNRRFGKGKDFRIVECHADRLYELTGSNLIGKRVFVNDVSDTFHESVPYSFIDKIFVQMSMMSRTTFQVLTKRPHIAYEWYKRHFEESTSFFWQPNIWLGISAENQETFHNRIQDLIKIPAPIKFLSCEPLIGPIELTNLDKISWVIAGGESGNGARPVHPDWIRSLRDQCAEHHIPFFFKQWGEYLPLEFDAQQPFRSFASDNIAIDGHCINVVDPEDSFKRGRYKGHLFMDIMHANMLCDLNDSERCDFWKCGKSKSGNFLDGKQHLEFPSL